MEATEQTEPIPDAPPEATERYVAFCDVLGFSNAVLNHFDDTIKIYADFMSRMRSWPLPDEVTVSVYSDSILIVSERLRPLLHALNDLCFATLTQDWMLRGGVAYGRYWEQRENGHVYVLSDALVRAVKLEKAVGVPAIAFSPEVTLGDELWFARFTHGIFSTPLLHYEGLTLINPFNPYWFSSAKLRVSQLLEQFPEHEKKYSWFLALADAVGRDEVLVPQSVLDRFLKNGVLKRREAE